MKASLTEKAQTPSMATKPETYPTIVTSDGSLTYAHPLHGCSYRSIKGASTESRHVFLGASRLSSQASPWRVLELGFGSGLNFANAAKLAEEMKAELYYTSLEPNPMAAELWLVSEEWKSIAWGKPLGIGRTTLTLQGARWQDFEPQRGHYNAIFHDPFAPAQNPDCWGVEVFYWEAAALSEGGVIATYGASSAARKNMLTAGLKVGVLPGACGKREMTVAARFREPIAHAKPWKK